jgi:Sulfotransferase family
VEELSLGADLKGAILVTGSHRSGTTWVGHMLATSPEVAYIHEPFNMFHRPGIFSAPCRQWQTYVCAENQAVYLRPVADMLRFRYQPSAELRTLRSARDVARMARDWSRFEKYRRQERRPLVKDPHAIFSAEWLSDAFGMNVILMIRHPAAFASSVKRLRWPGGLTDMLSQPLLMRDVLDPFREDLERAAGGTDVIERAIVGWRVVYHTVRRYQSQRPDWLFLRHEDVARAPVDAFHRVFSTLGLQFTPAARANIARHSNRANPTDVADPYWIRRNSASLVSRWRLSLTPEEIERVQEGTRDIWPHFYSDADWGPDVSDPSGIRA